MRVLLKFLYFFIGSFMGIWMVGCSNKFFDDLYMKSLSPVIQKSYLRLENINKKDFVIDRSVSSGSHNSYIISGNRYSYTYINRGSYSSCCYTVKPGDTLFYIAWITDNDYRVLAKKNNIHVNSILKVGQILRVDNGQDNLNCRVTIRNIKNNIKKGLNVCSTIDTPKLKDLPASSNQNFLNKNPKNSLSSSKNDTNVKYGTHNTTNIVSDKSKIITDRLSFVEKSKKEFGIIWNWPTQGKVINTFSSSEGGNKGIDIIGVIGQFIFSASSGKVVYVGDALFGYGNLIIIKHNNDFLSTYAHNDKILVVEQQQVVRGQKIATMGNSGSDVIKLHFEIRYQGKSVDPLYYLPKKDL